MLIVESRCVMSFVSIKILGWARNYEAVKMRCKKCFKKCQKSNFPKVICAGVFLNEKHGSIEISRIWEKLKTGQFWDEDIVYQCVYSNPFQALFLSGTS